MMIKFLGKIFLVLLLTGTLLAGGCITSSSEPSRMPANLNSPATPTLPVATDLPDASRVPVQCPQENTGLYIGINPITHHYLGDIIIFTGTTNLPAGENITLKIHTTAFMPCPKWSCCCSVVPCCEGINDTVIILPENCGVNTWSWEVNTSQHGFRPDGEYIISASGRNGALDNFSIFTVSGIPKSNITLNLPANDPDGNALRFSGQVNTGNGLEEILLLTVSSDSGKKVSSTVLVFQNGTGYYWNFTLKKTEITPYNFLSVNVSSATSPEIRIERTFLYNNEPVFYPYNPYSS